MFRSRFSDAFPKSLPHYGPQDVEGGVVEPIPSEQIERLLCALLGLVLNRKKDVEWVTPPQAAGLWLERETTSSKISSLQADAILYRLGEGISDAR